MPITSETVITFVKTLEPKLKVCTSFVSSFIYLNLQIQHSYKNCAIVEKMMVEPIRS